MKILILISSLFTVAVAQEPSLTCNYYSAGSQYGCDLSINNPNGFNNFTEIGGIHLDGFTNENVTSLTRRSGVSSIVPSIICDTFPNIRTLSFANAGVTKVGDSEFSGCTHVYALYLASNRITSISTNAFVTLFGLSILYLDNNFISTLPSDVFASQQNLLQLDLSSNPFNVIQSDIFRPLQNLYSLSLSNANISEINNEWFATNENLNYLYLSRNKIRLSRNNFDGLNGLRELDLGYNGITEIPVGVFTALPNLKSLYLNGNNFTELQADSFPDLSELTELDISNNTIEMIHEGAFRGLLKLTQLTMINCRLSQLQPSCFGNLENLISLTLNWNEIEELPADIFAENYNLRYISLWGNRLKTIRRNSFGILSNLKSIDLESNIVNALDRAVIDDAVNLDSLYLYGNLCASNSFVNFPSRRAQHLTALERCFRNFLYVVDTVTEAGDEYSFFEAPRPGIALRVNTAAEVQIALTPFNVIETQIIEILIGMTNNTGSAIRINQETNVVTVSTPNIVIPDQWNDFRVTWANQVILVFSGNNTYPFMGFTMQNFFSIDFYGLRAVETRATWTVQPLE